MPDPFRILVLYQGDRSQYDHIQGFKDALSGKTIKGTPFEVIELDSWLKEKLKFNGYHERFIKACHEFDLAIGFHLLDKRPGHECGNLWLEAGTWAALRNNLDILIVRHERDKDLKPPSNVANLPLVRAQSGQDLCDQLLEILDERESSGESSSKWDKRDLERIRQTLPCVAHWSADEVVHCGGPHDESRHCTGRRKALRLIGEFAESLERLGKSDQVARGLDDLTRDCGLLVGENQRDSISVRLRMQQVEDEVANLAQIVGWVRGTPVPSVGELAGRLGTLIRERDRHYFAPRLERFATAWHALLTEEHRDYHWRVSGERGEANSDDARLYQWFFDLWDKGILILPALNEYSADRFRTIRDAFAARTGPIPPHQLDALLTFWANALNSDGRQPSHFAPAGEETSR